MVGYILKKITADGLKDDDQSVVEVEREQGADDRGTENVENRDFSDHREGVRCGLELSPQRNPLSVDQAMLLKAFGGPGMWEGWKPVGRQSR